MKLKDVIRTFETERPPAVEETVAASPVVEIADGPTALVMVEFLDTVDALAALLEEETAAVTAGSLAVLESFAARKATLADSIDALTEQASGERLTLTPDVRAMALDRIDRLDRATVANTTALVALRGALLTINRALFTALERAASDGVYSGGGLPLRPVELSASGLDATL